MSRLGGFGGIFKRYLNLHDGLQDEPFGLEFFLLLLFQYSCLVQNANRLYLRKVPQGQQPRSARAASKAPMNPNPNSNPTPASQTPSHKGRPPGANGTNSSSSSKNNPNSSGPSVNNNSKIWSTSTTEERERIKEFWLSLGEEERRNLVKIEKDTVLRKMKEQQKHQCGCAVCGRKR